jgi:hypothetical protein
LHIEALEAREVPHVHGVVFIDLNMDGILDPEDIGVENVTVTATDSTGASTSATTDATGSYELETDAEVRIEFSGLPEGTMPGRVAGTSGAMVRFVGAERDNVDLALAQPMLVTSQFYYDQIDGTTRPVRGSGRAVWRRTIHSITWQWVLNWRRVDTSPSSNSVASSLKRHAGLGPNAAGTGTTTGGVIESIVRHRLRSRCSSI